MTRSYQLLWQKQQRRAGADRRREGGPREEVYIGAGGALGAERYTLLLFAVTVLLSLLMVSSVRFRSFKDLQLNTGTVLLVLFVIGSSAFVWQRFTPQFVLVWLLSFYIFIGLVESARMIGHRLIHGPASPRDSLPPVQPS